MSGSFPAAGSPARWAGRAVTNARAWLAARTSWPAACGRCGGPVSPTWWHLGHRLDRQAHPELTWETSNWQIEHPRCSTSAGARQGNSRRARPAAQRLRLAASQPQVEVDTSPRRGSAQRDASRVSSVAPGGRAAPPVLSLPGLLPADIGPIPADLADLPWMAPVFAGLGPTSVWPRLMTAAHPRAVGSYGPEMLEWSAQRLGMHPKRTTGQRWWQKLVACRALEHDAAGRLVWNTIVLTLARQLGKSWLLRELCMWRLAQAERLGEMQTVVHTAAKLSQAYGVWRPAARWAGRNGYGVRLTNGEQVIEDPRSGSLWLIQAANDDLGVSYSVSMGLVDESWRVARHVFENSLEPTAAEALDSQMYLISTAGVPRVGQPSDLMPLYLAHGERELEAPGSLLLLNWSAHPQADRRDPAAWRSASPHWTAERADLVAGKLAKATTPAAIAAFDFQWLNRWPPFAGEQELLLVQPAAWARLAVPGAGGPWAVAAVEAARFGTPVVVLARRLDDGRALLSATRVPDTAAAAQTCRDAGVAVTLVGKSLLADPCWADLACEKRQGTDADAAAALGRLVTERAIAHDNSPVLADQVTGTPMLAGAGGALRPGVAGLDAVKAAVWAAEHARTFVPFFAY